MSTKYSECQRILENLHLSTTSICFFVIINFKLLSRVYISSIESITERIFDSTFCRKIQEPLTRRRFVDGAIFMSFLIRDIITYRNWATVYRSWNFKVE